MYHHFYIEIKSGLLHVVQLPLKRKGISVFYFIYFLFPKFFSFLLVCYG